MRVIRTEMYFANNSLDDGYGGNLPNPGISFAFFRGVPSPALTYLIDDSNVEDIFDRSIIVETPSERSRAFRCALGVFAGEGTFDDIEANLSKGRELNSPIVNYVLQQNVVVEQSPPEWLHVTKLLSSSPIAIGTFIGFGMSSGNPTLMLVTVPMGIIVIGAASGISKGLERGLNKVLEKRIDQYLK